MTRYAIVDAEGTVQNIVRGRPPEREGYEVVELGDRPAWKGGTYDPEAGTFARPRPSHEALVQQVRREARHRESLGLTYKGHHIDTDPESVARLTSATVQAGRDSSRDRTWRNSRGERVSLTAEEVKDLADRVDDYIQAVLQREDELLEELEQADDPLEVDLDSGWPDPGDYSS